MTEPQAIAFIGCLKADLVKCHALTKEGEEAFQIAIEAMMRTVKQPEIIRCKDCRWHGSYSLCGLYVCYTQDDGYCYQAERRSE